MWFSSLSAIFLFKKLYYICIAIVKNVESNSVMFFLARYLIVAGFFML